MSPVDHAFIPRMKVYLAGPMTGIPQFNFPLFDRVAAEIRAFDGDLATYDVVSPAELDDPEARAAALQSEWGDPAEYANLTGMTWADFLSRDVKLIADGGFDYIICLPGWEQSRGARLETFVGHLTGIPIMKYVGGGQIASVTLPEKAAAWVAYPGIEFRAAP